MARAPFQVLVLPFRRLRDRPIEYAVFRRSDDGLWQGIAGGGEGDETPLAAARREALEEAAIADDARFYPLTTTEHVPASCFAERDGWAADVYVVPQHFFACDATDVSLVLSSEHDDFKWVEYAEAHALLRYDSNKTALWELFERLRVDDLPLGPADERHPSGMGDERVVERMRCTRNGDADYDARCSGQLARLSYSKARLSAGLRCPWTPRAGCVLGSPSRC